MGVVDLTKNQITTEPSEQAMDFLDDPNHLKMERSGKHLRETDMVPVYLKVSAVILRSRLVLNYCNSMIIVFQSKKGF